MLQGRRILLIIAGGIAAYKSLELIRRLREQGAAVRCVMTEAARQFVAPLSVGSLSEATDKGVTNWRAASVITQRTAAPWSRRRRISSRLL